MKLLLTLSFFLAYISFSQIDALIAPKQFPTGAPANWEDIKYRSLGDSCGPYFNNYIGQSKTSHLYFESMRTGNGSDFSPYTGRAQRFHANQEIEVSGIQFFGFNTNPLVDSIMVVTLLHDYDALIDSLGAELARDTVWVKHTAFTPVLPDIQVNSYFPSPVTVSSDYIVAIYTSTNDSLKIITSSALHNDGKGEGVSFVYYDNLFAPSYTGWYATLPTFGPVYDLDYLINPRVKFNLNPGFTVNKDTICPKILGALCAEYIAVPNMSDKHYNKNADTPKQHIGWLWDDGSQNTKLTNLCHTYAVPGNYVVTLKDTLRRYNYADINCVFNSTKSILVIDSAQANFSAVTTGYTTTFTNESILASTYFWEFGDGNTSTDEHPVHTYDIIGDYEITLYATGDCNTDSTAYTVTLTDVGIATLDKWTKIYPNPANQNLTISFSENQTGASVLLFNILGEPVSELLSVTKTKTLAVGHLASGTYFIQIQKEGRVEMKKIIIKH